MENSCCEIMTITATLRSTATDYTKFDDLMYASANAQGVSASGTPMVFHHAMTSVVFIAKCNVAYDEATNAGITIDGITIDGAKHSGTLTVSNPSAGKGLEACPRCGSPRLDILQRITGYLVGTTDRWNAGKKAELKDRVIHR